MSETGWKGVARRYGHGLLCIGLLALGSPGLAADPPVIADLPGAPAFDASLRTKLQQTLASRPADFEARTQHKRSDGSPLYTNRLALETSPYLLQHSHNPVNWYPWGSEAFAEAKRRGVPLFVSVGYSTCHWCHVMEEESFDDPDVAKLLNNSFVAIKVDRESRPDIDEILMAAVHAMGERGGWPLNVWLTPGGQAFYGGTYFPPVNSPRRPGFREILNTIAERWAADPEKIDQLAARVNESVRERLGGSASSSRGGNPEPRHLRAAMESLRPRVDHAWGGLQTRIKFPSGLPIAFLLRYYRRTGDPEALAAAELTLEKMADGGLRDALGGGFHRYSTDRLWRVPHFEKMLYDNALLVPLYIEAFQVTGREDFEAVARDTLDYLAREMQSAQGGFYSATDADSAGPGGEMEEGLYFTWTPDEIEAVVGAERAPLVAAAFGVTPKGHLDGRSVLHRASSPGEIAARFGRPETQVRSTLAGASRELLAARQSRIPPLLDDKILAAWNGLAISAFARAGFALDEPRYTETARKAARFVLESMRRGGRLLRVYREGRASGPAFLDDYAFVIAGLLDLYEADPDPRWLEEAVALQAVQDSLYADPDGGGYFTTARDHEKLPVRSKPSRDGAVPSGNSVSALNLLRLASFTENADYSRRAKALFRAFQEKIESTPLDVGVLLTAVDYQLDTPLEIMIVLPPSGRGGPALLSPVRETFVPNRILSVVREGAGFEEHAQIVPLLESKRAIHGRATAYVCVDRTCSYPASDPTTLAQQLGATQPLPTPKPVEKAN